MILSIFFKKIYMVICFIENGINFGKKFGTFFWKFFYVPEKKKFKIFVGIFQKKLYGHLFHRKWNNFWKKNFKIFWKILPKGKISPEKWKFFARFYSHGYSPQFGTKIRFLSYPEAEIEFLFISSPLVAQKWPKSGTSPLPIFGDFFWEFLTSKWIEITKNIAGAFECRFFFRFDCTTRMW